MIHRPHTTSPSTTLAKTSLLVAACILVLPGCQTFNSTFTSMPKLPKLSEMKLPGPPNLAFWKKESEVAPPPPPAHHLSPSSTSGFDALEKQTESIARNGIDIDEFRQKIDDLADAKQPLRKPYESANRAIAKTANEFKSSFKGVGDTLDRGLSKAKQDFKSLESNTLSDAQNRFNAAIADVKKTTAGNNDFKSPSEFLSTKPANDFKAALAKTNAQLQSGFKQGVDTARKTVGGLDQSMAKVNKSLYDMNGNLTTSSTNATKQVASSVDAARERFSSALGTVSDKAIEAAKNSTEFGSDITNKIVAKANEFKPQLRGSDNSFKPAFSQSVDPIATEAKNLLDKAKQKVAGLGTGFDFPESAPKTQVQIPEFKPSQDSNSFGGSFASKPAPPTRTQNSFVSDNFNRTRVANVTPVNSGDSAVQKPAGLASSLTNQWNNGDRQSQLKPVGGGSTNVTPPGNGLRTASASSGFGSGASSIPAFGGGRTAPASHVMEIDIPAKVLSGAGSYAPGSVNKVR